MAVGGLAAGLLVGRGWHSDGARPAGAVHPRPERRLPVGRLAMLAALVLATTLVSGLVATVILRRLKPTEIMREE